MKQLREIQCNQECRNTATEVLSKSFHKKREDPVTGKSVTWITTSKEKAGTLSSIVAVKSTTSEIKFGKVDHFSVDTVDDINL